SFGFALGANAVAVAPDGKIVAAGDGSNGYTFARFNVDGSLDTTFNGTGSQSYAFAGRHNSRALGVAIDAAARVRGVGATNGPTGPGMGIIRLNSDGSLDTTFNGTGTRTLSYGGVNESLDAVAIDAAGRIVVAGSSFTLLPPPSPGTAPQQQPTNFDV